MALPILLATLLQAPIQQPPSNPAQTPPANQTPANPAPAQTPPAPAPLSPTALTTAQTVVEPHRIALTPKIDGKLDEEEWDPLVAGGPVTGYLEWEPNKIHVAAKIPAGQDLLLSFDFDNNGWLIGKDNLEVRVGMRDGKPVVTGRLLDAANAAGPVWKDLPGLTLSSQAAETEDPAGSTYEVTLVDPGIGLFPTADGSKLGVRYDAIPADTPPLAPFLPRVVSPVEFVLKRSAGLPSGLKFEPEGEGRTVVAGERTRIRLTFQGNPGLKLQRLDMRSEGFAKGDTDTLGTPFPAFDSKNRAFIDYNTGVSAQAGEGYRVLRGTLTAADGVSGVLQTSYRIAPLVDANLIRQNVPVSQKDRSIRFGFDVQSNSGKLVAGRVTIRVPEPLRILNSDERKFRIEVSRARSRQTFDLFVPTGTTGTFPVTFQIEVNGAKYEQRGFIAIGS